MEKRIVQWMVLGLVAASCGLQASPSDSIRPYHVEKDPQIIVEPDQTDVYAIPLDEDAEDEQKKLYNLEHPDGK